jgi:hypothetical protein
MLEKEKNNINPLPFREVSELTDMWGYFGNSEIRKDEIP